MVNKTSNTTASQTSTSQCTDLAIFYVVRAPTMSEVNTLQDKTTRVARQPHYNVVFFKEFRIHHFRDITKSL
jgi:hypothetical protein